MGALNMLLLVTVFIMEQLSAETIQLPNFSEMKRYYPGFYNFGGACRNHEIISLLGIEKNDNMLLHDTTALRLSHALNKIGNQHSIGNDVIRLSKYGTDSIPGKDHHQYLFHPLAFGPYLADKYGYPNVTKMHFFDPVKTKESFVNKQGIMRVITYTQHENEPKGHVVLWDCNGFYESRDFFYGHTLLSVEFWEAPDTNCDITNNGSAKNGMRTQKNEVDSYLLTVLKQARHGSRHRKQCGRYRYTRYYKDTGESWTAAMERACLVVERPYHNSLR